MAKKYYAVHQGKIPGVYETWAECQKQVSGYSGAKFKSFKTRAEAEAFAKGESINNSSVKTGNVKTTNNKSVKYANRVKDTDAKSMDRTVSERQDNCEAFAYIDGSFEKSINTVGYGGVIIRDGKEIKFSRGTKEPFYTAYWNISGELLAAVEVMKYARANNIKSFAIYFDCLGIEKWAKGKWKTNNPLTKKYAAFAKEIQEDIHIEFYKVAAHTGVHYNEIADQLAKDGLKKA